MSLDADPGLQHPKVRVASKSSARVVPRTAWWGSFALLAVVWLLVLNQQRLEWSVNPTYAYGWAVPLLAGYLFYERWRTRPSITGSGNYHIWLIVPALLLLAYFLSALSRKPILTG